MEAAAGAALYHDLQGLAALRTKASNTPDDAIAQVATQFESLFVQMALKSMRDATIDGGLFNSDQMEMYQSMFDQQLALDLSARGGLGLSEILVAELGGETPPVTSAPAAPLDPLAALRSARQQMLDKAEATGTVASQPSTSAPTPAQSATPAWQPASPEEFIRAVWQHARDAAAQLGLDPAVLVAQSALESGWGQRVVKAVNGASSFNLFGIKADPNWLGEAAARKTVEFHDGLASLEQASFRVYDSIAGSFEDYVAYLKSNPRYEQTLEKVADSGEFLRELQSAGYATDPSYAEKILTITGQSSFSAVVEELKKF